MQFDGQDVAALSVACLLLLSVILARTGSASHAFQANLGTICVGILTLLSLWMLAGVSCDLNVGRAAWAGLSSAGSACLFQSALQLKMSLKHTIISFVAFHVVGLLLGVLVITNCSSSPAMPILAWGVAIVGIALAACAIFEQPAQTVKSKADNDGDDQVVGTLSILDRATEVLAQTFATVPASVSSKLHRVKQLLNDAKLSAKADVVLVAAATTSSRVTETTASVPTAYRSNRSLLDKETTRWLTTELQAASTRSFVRMGTKLREGIKANQAHRTELMRTTSDHSNQQTMLTSQDQSAVLVAQDSSRSSSRPTPPPKALTNSEIRNTLSRVSLRQTASVVSVLPNSSKDVLSRTRHGSSGSTGFGTPALTPGKTMELGELAEMVSEVGMDSSDDAASETDSRDTFASGDKSKSTAQQRLLAARSFYRVPSNPRLKQQSLVRTFSQPGSMQQLVRAGSSGEATNSDDLMNFLQCTYDDDDEYVRTRTLLYRKDVSFGGLPIPTNLQFVVAFSGMDKWKFNVFRAGAQCGARPLACIASVALEGMGLLDILSVKRKVFAAFIMELERTYCHDPAFPNPYHNSFHAADVVQATQQFLLNRRVNGVLTDLNAAACLIAAAAHDYRHPGVNNTFLVNTGNELAVRYNDMAVLEHFHAAETFQVMNSSSTNILGGLDVAGRRSMRTSIIQCILATDLADGAKYSQRFADRADKIETEQVPSDHLVLMQMCLKCADVCHAARPLSVHEKWSLLVTVEFHQQGDIERNMNIPISPLCDRNAFNMARSQLGFVEFVVRPCIAPFAAWCKNTEWMECLHANELHWLNMRAMEDVAASESKRKSPSMEPASPPAPAAMTPVKAGDSPVPLTIVAQKGMQYEHKSSSG